MTIRTFQPGDDLAQVSIYNEAAGALPHFKPATLDEVRRRCHASEFDPSTRFFAEVNGQPVGYLTIQENGRISFPWCREGFLDQAPLLLEKGLEGLRQRGIRLAFTAYRGDWPLTREFFLRNGFSQAREVINFVMDLVDMPTPSARPSSLIGPISPKDIPAILEIGRGILRISEPDALEKYLFRNPYFSPDNLFALRSKADGRPVALGILITDTTYAKPHQLDAGMPCYRLGAFGSEGLTTKRVDGLFSFLAENNSDVILSGLDLLGYATNKLQFTDVETYAAQVPTDAPHLFRFYKNLFRRQGSFPVFERNL